MTAPTELVLRAALIGEFEDLEDDIHRVAAEETPFGSNIGKRKVKSIMPEWLIESLATPDETAVALDGDDVSTLDAAHHPARRSVYMQINRKTGGVSRTSQLSDRAGRADEVDYQKMIKGIEMRRDFEKRIVGNFASIAETGATTRKTAGALAWIATNDALGAGGSSGGWSSAGVVGAATSGTARTYTETLLKGVLVTAFTNGAKLSQCYVGGTHKQVMSAFTGIADIRASVSNNNQATIYGAADTYVSDFGPITIIPHPYGLTADALLIDPSGWDVGTYDGVKTVALAKTGDSDRFLMTMEKGLIAKNELKGACIRALS